MMNISWLSEISLFDQQRSTLASNFQQSTKTTTNNNHLRASNSTISNRNLTLYHNQIHWKPTQFCEPPKVPEQWTSNKPFVRDSNSIPPDGRSTNWWPQFIHHIFWDLGKCRDKSWIRQYHNLEQPDGLYCDRHFLWWVAPSVFRYMSSDPVSRLEYQRMGYNSAGWPWSRTPVLVQHR